MTLKLGASSHVYQWKLSLEECLRAVADLGYRYVELTAAPPHFWPRGMSEKERMAIKDFIKKCGLEIASLNPTGQDINLASTNTGIYAETVTQLKELIKLAHDLGAQIIAVPAGRVHTLVPAPPELVKQLTRDAILACLDEAAKYEVFFGLESVPYSFLKRGDDLVEFMHELNDHPYLKLIYDVANAYMVEDVIQGLSVVAPYLGLVHVSDTVKAHWGHNSIGTGEIDFKPVASKLRELGYQGITILEVFDLSDPSGSLKASAERLEMLGWQR